MSIADKLTTIANNVPLVYEAGKAAGGGGFPVEEKDVNFYDYDGTLLYGYTLDEIQNMTELPPGPDWHAELVFYEWNWTLESLKAEGYQIDVGALYDTDDSAAHLHITVVEHNTDPMELVVSSSYGCIDWGDGSEIENVSVSAPTVFTHQYARSGNYIVRVWDSAGGQCRLGYSSGSLNCFNVASTSELTNVLLKKAFIGTNCQTERYCLAYCMQLEHATLNPIRGFSYAIFTQSNNLACSHGTRAGDTSGYNAYFSCKSLRVATLADTSTLIRAAQYRDCPSLKRIRAKRSILLSETYGFYNNQSLQEVRGETRSSNTSTFQSCNSLVKIHVAEGSTGFGSNMFNSCFSLQEIDIPLTVTSIATKAFYGCYNMKRMRFRPETPPTVANADAFGLIPTSCVVEVPTASLAAYQEATNYSSIAAQMVGV